MKYILIFLFVSSLASAEDDPQKPVEKLGTEKVHEIQMTKEQADAAQKAVVESFEEGFKNSSPETQKAILKAAKELESQSASTTTEKATGDSSQ